MMTRLMALLFLIVFAVTPADSADRFLVVGGGYSPTGNQASLEKNVLLFDRVLKDVGLNDIQRDCFFADGNESGKDLEVQDPASLPKANRLMAEFFGSKTNLGLSYRNHQVPKVRGSSKPDSIRKWFSTSGTELTSGDRLIVYVTAHGSESKDRSNTHNTTIAMWNRSALKVTEFVELLDGLNEGVEVAVVMVQCHAGGFARFIFNDADPKKGLSNQRRCGFFATVYDRPAAGCTSEIDEANYVEYSTYFWAALSGKDRLGNKIDPPDYNKDGVVSFDEAHAYTVITADTIDLPLKTSDEFLDQASQFGRNNSKLIPNDPSYSVVFDLASTSEQAILTQLSKQLELSGEGRIVDAWQKTQERRSRGRGGRGRPSSNNDPAAALRSRIASSVRKQWPGLANVVNPIAIELMTSRSDEFVEAIESHRDYARYRELADTDQPSESKKRVKYERFLRTVDSIILAENLKRSGDESKQAYYQNLLKGESSGLVQE